MFVFPRTDTKHAAPEAPTATDKHGTSLSIGDARVPRCLLSLSPLQCRIGSHAAPAETRRLPTQAQLEHENQSRHEDFDRKQLLVLLVLLTVSGVARRKLSPRLYRREAVADVLQEAH